MAVSQWDREGKEKDFNETSGSSPPSRPTKETRNGMDRLERKKRAYIKKVQLIIRNHTNATEKKSDEMFIDQTTRMLNNLCVLFFWSLNDDDDWNSQLRMGRRRRKTSSESSTSFRSLFGPRLCWSSLKKFQNIFFFSFFYRVVVDKWWRWECEALWDFLGVHCWFVCMQV